MTHIDSKGIEMPSRCFPSFALGLLCMASSAPVAAQAVSVPAFKSIQLNGGGKVNLRPGPVQSVTIRQGSTEFTGIRVMPEGRLVIDACNRRCPNQYNLEIDIQTPDIEAVSINGGGDIVAQTGFGPQGHLAVSVQGGGDIDLSALPASDVAASVRGGGTAQLNARETLTAAVQGGGEILYAGDPAVTSSTRGGGTIRKVR